MNPSITDVGPWSEVKLTILRKYARAYNTILASRYPKWPRIYIDAFSGAGVHISRVTGDFILGSPLNALLVEPPFSEFHFVDIDGDKIESLANATNGRTECIKLYSRDANSVLVEEIFPQVRYKDFRRGLCLLDPYGLHLDWKVVHAAGRSKSLEIFLNFPVMDINMNVLRRDPSKVDPRQRDRMTRFWGDESWRDIAYDSRQDLFGFEEKVRNETLASAYRKRLVEVAGFSHVPEALPMKNSTNSIVYYLFFASQQPVAGHIVKEIFDKYR